MPCRTHYLAFALALTLLSTAPLHAAEYRARDLAAYEAITAGTLQPGDTLILEAGEWKDVSLLFKGEGTQEKPITLKAALPGQVRLTGNSSLRLAGSHLIVEGLWFHNAFPEKSDIITFREDSKKLASHCTLRECAIIQDVVSADKKERKWVSLYGAGHHVERCHFEGKTSKGTLLVVWLPEAGGEPPKHRVEKNHFGPRPRLGKNGGEIIRVGDSDTSMQSAACVISGNLFEKCDGEVECISNKSCDNRYVGNTFLECQGTITLRHGNRCLVEHNWFDGKHRKETGGIRVIGEDHVVRGNVLRGLEGDGARSALCLMNGMVDSPANGYFQVKKAVLQGNWVEDCKHCLLIGHADKDVKAPLAPVDCVIEGNTFLGREKSRIVDLADPSVGIQWKNNLMHGGDPGIPPDAGIQIAGERPTRTASASQVRPLQRKEVGTSWLPAK